MDAETVHICSGVKRKVEESLPSVRTKSRRLDNGTSTPLSQVAQREDMVPPKHGPRPIVDMVLTRSKGKQRKVWVLLDTGSTSPLLSKDLAKDLKMHIIKRYKPLEIRNFNNEVVERSR
jgi:hypothetical protein